METTASSEASLPPPAESSYEIALSDTLHSSRGLHRVPRAIRTTPKPPVTLLEDLATIHHLLNFDPVEDHLMAEHAVIETFCSLVWGQRTWQVYIAAARSFGRPALRMQHLEEAAKLPHRVDCIYRNRAVELFSEVVEQMKAVDFELGCNLESCKGDWMLRFRSHA